MNKTKWLTAILIFGVLAVAFFMGGNDRNSATRTGASQPESKAAGERSVLPPAAEHKQAQPTGQQPSSPVLTGEEELKTAPGNTKSQEAKESDQDHTEQTSDPKDEAKSPSVKTEADNNPDNNNPDSNAGQSKTDSSTKSKPGSKPGNKPVNKQEKQSAPKDKYLTDPVPKGKPKPVEWQDAKVDKSEKLTMTLSVTASTILDNLDNFNPDKLEVLPKDGVIYKAQTVTFNKGESVFDVLLREMKKNKIQMEFEMTPIYNSNYIEGIHNLYEFDCGELSGWMYKVNGWFPNYGSSRYVLQDGDVVEWVYTCDLGRDVGGSNASGGGKE